MTRQPRNTRPVCKRCGWSGKVMTKAVARYALSRHSCEKYERDCARAQRVAERIARDEPPAPCLHKQTTHVHGTHACYVLDRCKCRPCREANLAYENQRSRDRAYGKESYVDAGPTREHLEALAAAGMGPKQIAKVSGVPHGVISGILYGKWRGNGERRARTKRIRPATAERLLAVEATLETLGAKVSVDPTGTRRRLQALIACGWSQARVAGELGWTGANFGRMLHGAQGVGATTALKVRHLYDRLWDVPPPETGHREKIAATRARNYAQAHGWVPPLAWDDDSIDDPSALPWWEDPDADTGTEEVDAFVENVEFIASHGETWPGIEQRLGQSKATITRQLMRTGRSDLAHQLATNTSLREAA